MGNVNKRIIQIVGLVVCLATLSFSHAWPQDAQKEAMITRLNSNTVGIVSGTLSGTYIIIANEMSSVLDDGDKLRILPISGKGSAQNIRDVLYLKGVDLAIVQSNILHHFRKTGEAGRNIEQRLRYIARLYNQEIHVIVRAGINSIDQLNGKKVNFSDIGSGTQLTAQLLFEKFGVQVQEVNVSQADALEKLRTGEIEATVFSGGKPVAAFSKLKNDFGLKFLPIPFTAATKTDFLPATLTNEDYPNLISKGDKVATLAESSILVAYNWPANSDRYRRVELFTRAFFEKFDQFLLAPRHPKWKEVNLSAEVPGWTRFAVAQELIDKEIAKRKDGPIVSKQSFEAFLAELASRGEKIPLSTEQRSALFEQYVEWTKSQTQR